CRQRVGRRRTKRNSSRGCSVKPVGRPGVAGPLGRSAGVGGIPSSPAASAPGSPSLDPLGRCWRGRAEGDPSSERASPGSQRLSRPPARRCHRCGLRVALFGAAWADDAGRLRRRSASRRGAGRPSGVVRRLQIDGRIRRQHRPRRIPGPDHEGEARHGGPDGPRRRAVALVRFPAPAEVDRDHGPLPVITDQAERAGSRTETSRPAALPHTPSKWWLKPLAFAPLLLLALLQLVLFFKIHAREQLLAERGVTTSAVVVGTGYHGDTDYLRVRLPECGCVVEVATTNVDGHSAGSSLPVLYDPQRPGRAKALVDRPNPYEGVVTMSAGLALGVAILVPLVWVARRRRRQALRLVASTAPTMQVRVEAWERTLNNTPIYYLSVYPAGSGSGTRPLLCMPVDAKILKQIPPATTLELFGTPEPGNVIALRTGDVVVTPAGRTRPAAYEDAKRSSHATITLTGTADVHETYPTPVPSVDGPLLRDAREAHLWRRTNHIFGWLVPM